MKKIVKICGVLFLLCFSFYYTEQIIYIMQSKDEIMIKIKENKDNYGVDFVNGIIDDNTIIPGINGIQVNIEKSFAKMKPSNVFSEYFFVYDQVVPEVSLSDNKDKVIIRGNSLKKAVAIITEKNSNIKKQLEEYGLIVDYDNICIVKYLNEKCESEQYKVLPSLIISHQNVLKLKNKIESGDIIFVEENVSNLEINLLLEEINFKDLKIISLNELISEENNVN